jgi:hypothetical protein
MLQPWDLKHPAGTGGLSCCAAELDCQPYEKAVVIAIDTLGAAIAGPFNIAQAVLESMIARVIAGTASPGVPPTVH